MKRIACALALLAVPFFSAASITAPTPNQEFYIDDTIAVSGMGTPGTQYMMSFNFVDSSSQNTVEQSQNITVNGLPPQAVFGHNFVPVLPGTPWHVTPTGGEHWIGMDGPGNDEAWVPNLKVKPH